MEVGSGGEVFGDLDSVVVAVVVDIVVVVGGGGPFMR